MQYIDSYCCIICIRLLDLCIWLPMGHLKINLNKNETNSSFKRINREVQYHFRLNYLCIYCKRNYSSIVYNLKDIFDNFLTFHHQTSLPSIYIYYLSIFFFTTKCYSWYSWKICLGKYNYLN